MKMRNKNKVETVKDGSIRPHIYMCSDWSLVTVDQAEKISGLTVDYIDMLANRSIIKRVVVENGDIKKYYLRHQIEKIFKGMEDSPCQTTEL